MSSTTIGIVGAGSIATTMHIPVLRAMDQVHIVWITDIDEKRAREVGRVNRLPFVYLGSDLKQLPKCDIVLLSIPLLPRHIYFDHYLTTTTALFVEKPLAINATEHTRLISAYDSWRLSVGYQRRFYANTNLMRRLILAGTFGSLVKVVVSEGGRVTRSNAGGAYVDESTINGGGLIRNLGCHSLDLVLWLTRANAFRIKDRQVAWDGETDRSGTASITLLNVLGVPGADCDFSWTVSWLEAQSNLIELQFEYAILTSSVSPGSSLHLVDDDGRLITRLSSSNTDGATTSSQAFYLEWSDVMKSVKQRQESQLSGRSCIATADLMDQLLER